MKANVQPASSDQFDEVRIVVIKAFDKLRGRLDGTTAQGWIGNSPAVDRLLEGLLPPEEVAPSAPLLELVNTVMLVATAGKFVAKDKFVVNISSEAKVKISGTGDNFNNWFLSGNSRIEEPIGETELRYHKLLKASVDGPIITTLGGRELVTTGLTHMYSLMEKQPYGPQSGVGPLLTNGWWNIFYVPQIVTKLKGNRFSYINKAGETVTEGVSNPAYLFEVNGQWYVLRAVRVFWLDVGWNVLAHSVEFSCRWDADFRVFSRNSVLRSLKTLAPAQT